MEWSYTECNIIGKAEIFKSVTVWETVSSELYSFRKNDTWKRITVVETAVTKALCSGRDINTEKWRILSKCVSPDSLYILWHIDCNKLIAVVKSLCADSCHSIRNRNLSKKITLTERTVINRYYTAWYLDRCYFLSEENTVADSRNSYSIDLIRNNDISSGAVICCNSKCAAFFLLRGEFRKRCSLISSL